VVVHRSVHAPWVGVGYQAPSQYSRDFPAMLVVSALLGQSGDAGALSFGSQAPLPEDFVGAYYQYEAQPGSLIIFLNGTEGSSIDQSIQELQLAIARLRAQSLPASVVDHGRRLAIGQYYMSVTTLGELAGLEGRAAMSPQGLSYVDAVPRAIARVSAADIRRVAQTYLKHETVGIVLPQSSR
jgi:zinc protease